MGLWIGESAKLGYWGGSTADGIFRGVFASEVDPYFHAHFVSTIPNDGHASARCRPVDGQAGSGMFALGSCSKSIGPSVTVAGDTKI